MLDCSHMLASIKVFLLAPEHPHMLWSGPRLPNTGRKFLRCLGQDGAVRTLGSKSAVSGMRSKVFRHRGMMARIRLKCTLSLHIYPPYAAYSS